MTSASRFVDRSAALVEDRAPVATTPSRSSGRLPPRMRPATASRRDGEEHDPDARRGRLRVAASSTAPPPRETTPPARERPRRPRRARARGSAARRARRRCPRSGRGRATISLSVSTNGSPSSRATRLPTLVLPAPIGPMRTSAGRARSCSMPASLEVAVRSVSGMRGEVAVEVAPRLGDASRRRTSRAPPRRARARPSPRRRRRRRARRRRPSAGGGLRMPSPRRDVDRAQRVRHRRDRLHARADAQHGAGRHAALGAARLVAEPGDQPSSMRRARRALRSRGGSSSGSRRRPRRP